MEKISARLRHLRVANGYSQEQVAKYCDDIKKASVSAWETGKTRPTLDALVSLSRLYQVTLDELALGHSSLASAPEFKGKVPLISWVAAGSAEEPIDIYLPGYADEWIPCAEPHSRKTYALRVDGHSMTSPVGRSYPSGIIIICDPEQAGGSHNGKRVIARMLDTGNVTFKEMVVEDGIHWLRSLNPHPQYAPITDPFEVIALVIASHIPE